MKLSNALSIAALSVAFSATGCSSHPTIEVTPGSPITDNFFITWELDSLRFGFASCVDAGTPVVNLDILNSDSGARQVSTFQCDAFQGTSAPLEMGTYDAVLTLNDAAGNVVSESDLGTENVAMSGTLNLGHIIFEVP